MSYHEKKLIPFEPHPLVPGGHLQTIIGYYLPWPKQISHTRTYEIELPDEDKLILCENTPVRKTAFQKAILLMHGLGGHSQSPYMLRLAEFYRNRGWITFRMNHRGCGEGVGLAKNIYHSGRSEDISQVLLKIEALYPETPLIAVGFSLSGNALLKLLGEKKEPISTNLLGAIATTPPIDLSLCAATLCKPSNRIYDYRFIQFLKDAIKERQQRFADFPKFDFPWNMSVRDFDEICTAPLNNFESAEDYYEKCNAKQFLARIAVPTLLLASDDDPFIPKESFDNLPENGNLTCSITRGGGHMGFVTANKTPLGNYRWMDYAILIYAERFLQSFSV